MLRGAAGSESAGDGEEDDFLVGEFCERCCQQLQTDGGRELIAGYSKTKLTRRSFKWKFIEIKEIEAWKLVRLPLSQPIDRWVEEEKKGRDTPLLAS